MRAADQHLLPRAHASLIEQGVEWRWVVEIDGRAEQVWDPQDDRVSVKASQRTLGVAAARNLALVAVITPYVALLDADDVLPIGSLATVLAGLKSSGCFAVSGGLRVVDDVSGAVHQRLPSAAAGVYAAGALPSLALQQRNLPTPTQAVTYRADALRAIGGWPGMVLCQDVAAFMLVAERWPVLVMHEVLYEYHRRDGQSTAATELAQHDLMLRSRVLLAQQLQAHRALFESCAMVVATDAPTY